MGVQLTYILIQDQHNITVKNKDLYVLQISAIWHRDFTLTSINSL